MTRGTSRECSRDKGGEGRGAIGQAGEDDALARESIKWQNNDVRKRKRSEEGSTVLREARKSREAGEARVPWYAEGKEEQQMREN